MPDMLNPDFAFRRLVERIDDPYVRQVMVILVAANGEVETASRGCKNDHEMFQLAHHVASGLASEIIPTLEPEMTRDGPKIIVPRPNGGRW